MSRPPLAVHSGGGTRGGAQAGASPPTLGERASVPFEVGGVLGRGGMGEVRTAYDPRLGRDVALKTVIPGDTASASRLAREGMLTARLEHPGIMPVYEAGRGEDGRPWYALRLFTGRTLGQAIAEAPSAADRLRLVRHVLDAAQAIAYAHGQGIFHRDLKPSNVLTGAFGETIVADWGLACSLEEAARSEAGAGTPGYMSPEQTAGRPIDGRTDVYGLGAILAEVLTARPPDDHGAPAVHDAPDAPPELVAIAERALQRAPEDRYPNARAFADDLLAWFEGRRVGAHEYSTAQLVRRLVTRWRVPIAVAGLGLLGVGIAGAIGWSTTVEERHRAELSEAEAVSARADEKRAFAAALRVQANIAAEGGLVMEAEVLAANALLRHDNAEARGVLAAAYGRPRWSQVASWPMPKCRRSTLSAEGKSIACVTDVDARIVDVEGRTPDRVAVGKWLRAGFAADPGAVILASDAGKAFAWSLGQDPRSLDVALSAWGAFPRSQLPGQAAVQGVMSELRVDFSSGRATSMRGCGPNAAVQAVALDRAGVLLTACNDRRVVRVSETGTPETFITLPDADGMPSLLQPLADGRLFVGTTGGRGVLIDAGGNVLARERLGDGAVYAADAHNDRVVVSLTGGDVTVWDAAANIVQMRFHGPLMEGVWLPDAQLRLLSTTIEDRRAPDAPRPHQFVLDAGVSAVTFSPDGRWLAVAAGNGVTTLFDPITGRTAHRLHGNDAVAKDVAFSTTGDALLIASAGTEQRTYRVPEGTLMTTALGFGARRAAWFAAAGPILAPYGPGLWRAPTSTDEKPVYMTQPGFQDLETNAAGTRAAALTADDTLWVGEDGPEVRWHRVASVAPSTGISVAGTDIFAATHTELMRYSADDEITWRTPIPGGVTDISASPDGRWAALGMLDGTLLVYEVGHPEPVARMAAHHARVSAVTFSADSQWLASGGWDNSVRVWSVAAFETDATTTAAAVEAAWGRKLDAVLTTMTGEHR